MKITQKYSHINGEEFLLVHHRDEYNEILNIIEKVDISKKKTKLYDANDRRNKFVYDAESINREFQQLFNECGWQKERRNFYVSTDPNIVRQLEPLDFGEQKDFLDKIDHPKYFSFTQTDFVKNKIAIEVQMGKYFAVTYDLFVKHLSFYTGQIINVGVEIVPTKNMQKEMSSGPPWFEKEVHNVLRHGRTNPPVPLLILGIEP